MEDTIKKINRLSLEKIVLTLLSLSFFIGTWHAFPMLNVIADEMYYVGGVLRAMENYTIVPLPDDVPYGTLTYLISYIMTPFLLVATLPFVGFSVSNLKIFLLESPWLVYLLLRITSSFLSMGMLFLVYKILKRELQDVKLSLFLSIILFTNIITTLVLHTGKMWVLSQLLALISFYYLYNAVATNNPAEEKNTRNIFLSILFSFIAFSNFPLNFFCLINIPILLYFFRKEKSFIYKILAYSFIGFVIFILVTLFNFTGIKNQITSIFTDYHPIDSESITKLYFWESLISYTKKLLVLFPLIVLTFLITLREGIRNKRLFAVSLIYSAAYFFAVVIVANYSLDFRSGLRYLFPLGFFLIFVIASFDLKFRKIFYVIGGISIFYFLFTLYYLSIPTTYNNAYNWVNKNLYNEESVIINEVFELQLINNKNSSLYTKEEYCSTKCKNIINLNLNDDFKPVVYHTVTSKTPEISSKDTVYYILEKPRDTPSLELIKSFDNPTEVYHSLDYNLGNYFDTDFFRIKNLGRNIYIYRNK